jgi:hypothetical protein
VTDRVNVAQYPLLRAAILIESGDEVAAETAANANTPSFTRVP